MTDLTHERASELLGSYAQKALDDATARAVGGHLAACEQCRREHSAVVLMLRQPRPSLTSEERAGLHERLAGATLGAGASGSRPAVLERERARRGARVYAWLGAAAVVVVVLVAAVQLWGGGGGGAGSAGVASSGGGTGSSHNKALQSIPGGRETGLPPSPAYDRSAGDIEASELEHLATTSPLFSAGRHLASSTAARLQDRYAHALARQAAPRDARTVRRCSRKVLTASPYALPVYGASGSVDGNRAIVIGFLRATAPGQALDRYVFWSFGAGSCSRILDYQSGLVGR